MCARSSHRRHRAGLGLLGIGNFFAGFSVPKDPGSSVRTSGPNLTVADSFKWSLVDHQTSTAKFQDFALLCIFFKDLTVVNGWWAYTQFFTPPFDVLSDLVVFGAYFQVANVDDSLFACRLFADDFFFLLFYTQIIESTSTNLENITRARKIGRHASGHLRLKNHIWRVKISF